MTIFSDLKKQRVCYISAGGSDAKTSCPNCRFEYYANVSECPKCSTPNSGSKYFTPKEVDRCGNSKGSILYWDSDTLNV